MNKKRVTVFGLIVMLVVLVFSSATSLIQAQDFGTNWTGTFFASNNLTGTGVPVSNIQGLNFNWGTGVPIINGVPVPGMPADNFSALFNSVQTFVGGTYTFTASSDDGIRVSIDGALLLDKFVGRALTQDTFSTTLSAGQHSITVEYFEGIDQAVLQFQWGLTGGVVTAGPSPTPGPTATPVPTGLPPIPGGALTATVIRAPVLNVRAGPSAFADRIGSLLRGQTYAVIGRDEHARWFLLQLSGKQGWALGYYLYFNTNEFNAPIVSDFVLGGNPAAASGVVAQAVGTLKLRAQHDVRSEQIGRVTWGGAVAIVGRTRYNDWYQVIWKGTTGWVAAQWVRVVEGDINTIPIVP